MQRILFALSLLILPAAVAAQDLTGGGGAASTIDVAGASCTLEELLSIEPAADENVATTDSTLKMLGVVSLACPLSSDTQLINDGEGTFNKCDNWEKKVTVTVKKGEKNPKETDAEAKERLHAAVKAAWAAVRCPISNGSCHYKYKSEEAKDALCVFDRYQPYQAGVPEKIVEGKVISYKLFAVKVCGFKCKDCVPAAAAGEPTATATPEVTAVATATAVPSPVATVDPVETGFVSTPLTSLVQ